MQSIFTRTYIAIALLMVAAFMLTVQFTDSTPSQRDWNEFVSAAQSHLKPLQDALLQTTIEDWQDLLLQHNTSATVKLSLRHSDSLTKLISRPEEVEFAMSAMTAESWWVIEKIPGFEYFLLAEEIPDLEHSIWSRLWVERYIPIISVFLALGIGIGHLAQRISRPVLALSSVAKRFGSGDLNVRAELDAPEPINELARDFNRMADQLDQIIQDQQVMIGAIPHELRLPLSRMRFALDLAQQAKNESERQRHLQRLDRSVNELAKAVEDIIFLTRTGYADKISMEVFDLMDVLHDLEREILPTGKQQLFDIHIEHLAVKGNAALLSRALRNLISNAQRHARQQIRISLEHNNTMIYIRVDDDGSGVPAEQREALFIPFMRLDHSRDRRTGGIGLGLSIVALVMRKHGGQVKINDSPLGGSRFELSWPGAMS